MMQTADEAGLELNMEMPGAANTQIAQGTANQEQDDLSQRLAALRQADWY